MFRGLGFTWLRGWSKSGGVDGEDCGGGLEGWAWHILLGNDVCSNRLRRKWSRKSVLCWVENRFTWRLGTVGFWSTIDLSCW